jgi:hypothetical protein
MSSADSSPNPNFPPTSDPFGISPVPINPINQPESQNEDGTIRQVGSVARELFEEAQSSRSPSPLNVSIQNVSSSTTTSNAATGAAGSGAASTNRSPELSYEELQQRERDRSLGKLTPQELGLTEGEFTASLSPERLAVSPQDFSSLTPQQRIAKLARIKMRELEAKRQADSGMAEILAQARIDQSVQREARAQETERVESEKTQFLRTFPGIFERLLREYGEALQRDIPKELAHVPSSQQQEYNRVAQKAHEIIELLQAAERLNLLGPRKQLDIFCVDSNVSGASALRDTPLSNFMRVILDGNICHERIAEEGLRLCAIMNRKLREG